MSVTRTLMGIGSFRVSLVDDVPYRIRSAIAGFDHIVVTGAPLDPISDFTDAAITGASIFTGVVEARRDSGRTIAGVGLEAWLGTSDGVGDVLDVAVTQSAAALSTWISALCPTSLAVGTVTDTGLSTLTNTYFGMTRREAIDGVCRAVNRAEWRVNADFTLDAADPELLFRFDPSIIITRKPDGPDSGYIGLEASNVVVNESVEGYTHRAICVSNGMHLGSASITPSYRDGRNNLVVMERFVNAPSEDPANAISVAGTVVDQYSVPRTELRLRSDTYSVTRFVDPGDWVYVYDLDAGVVDSANQVPFRGDLITPKKLRVYGLTFPIERGMGVYARRSTGSGYTYTDLTPYVEWEDTDVEWEVGAADLPLSAGGVSGTGARLGDNGDIAARYATGLGEVASATATTGITSVTTETDITGLSVTWTAEASRRYRISAHVEVSGTVANDLVIIYIADGSNTHQQRALCHIPTPIALAGGAGYVTLDPWVIQSGLSGSTTRKVRIVRNVGTGTVGVNASASYPIHILVEDIGPA